MTIQQCKYVLKIAECGSFNEAAKQLFVACSTVGKASIGSEGIYVEVYEDYVLIRGRDFAQGKWCGSMQIKIPAASRR